MPTTHVKLFLPDYVTGRLNPDIRPGVEEHLSTCDVCRRELEAFRQTALSLQEHREMAHPSGYFSSFLFRLRDRQERERSDSWLQSPFLTRFAAPLMAGALVVMLMIRFPILPSEENTGAEGILPGFARTLTDQELSQILAEQGSVSLSMSVNGDLMVPYSLIDNFLRDELMSGAGKSEPVFSSGGESLESLDQLTTTQVELLLERLQERSIL